MENHFLKCTEHLDEITILQKCIMGRYLQLHPSAIFIRDFQETLSQDDSSGESILGALSKDPNLLLPDIEVFYADFSKCIAEQINSLVSIYGQSFPELGGYVEKYLIGSDEVEKLIHKIKSSNSSLLVSMGLFSSQLKTCRNIIEPVYNSSKKQEGDDLISGAMTVLAGLLSPAMGIMSFAYAAKKHYDQDNQMTQLDKRMNEELAKLDECFEKYEHHLQRHFDEVEKVLRSVFDKLNPLLKSILQDFKNRNSSLDDFESKLKRYLQGYMGINSCDLLRILEEDVQNNEQYPSTTYLNLKRKIKEAA